MRKSYIKILYLLLVYGLIINGWIEEKLEKKTVSTELVKKKLYLNYSIITNNIKRDKKNYKELEKKFQGYTNISARLLTLKKINDHPDKIAEYKLGYSDISQNSKNILEDFTESLNIITKTEDKIKSYANNIINSNSTSKKTVEYTKAELNKILTQYKSIKDYYSGSIKTLKEWRDTISNIHQQIENRLKNKEKAIDRPETKTKNNLKNTVEREKEIKEKIAIINKTTEQNEDILKINKDSKKLLQEADKKFEAGNYDAALKLYKEAVKKDNRNFRARANMSKIYLKEGKTDKAIEEINKAIETFKKSQ